MSNHDNNCLSTFLNGSDSTEEDQKQSQIIKWKNVPLSPIPPPQDLQSIEDILRLCPDEFQLYGIPPSPSWCSNQFARDFQLQCIPASPQVNSPLPSPVITLETEEERSPPKDETPMSKWNVDSIKLEDISLTIPPPRVKDQEKKESKGRTRIIAIGTQYMGCTSQQAERLLCGENPSQIFQVMDMINQITSLRKIDAVAVTRHDWEVQCKRVVLIQSCMRFLHDRWLDVKKTMAYLKKEFPLMSEKDMIYHAVGQAFTACVRKLSSTERRDMRRRRVKRSNQNRKYSTKRSRKDSSEDEWSNRSDESSEEEEYDWTFENMNKKKRKRKESASLTLPRTDAKPMDNLSWVFDYPLERFLIRELTDMVLEYFEAEKWPKTLIGTTFCAAFAYKKMTFTKGSRCLFRTASLFDTDGSTVVKKDLYFYADYTPHGSWNPS